MQSHDNASKGNMPSKLLWVIKQSCITYWITGFIRMHRNLVTSSMVKSFKQRKHGRSLSIRRL